jgi:ribosomal protein S18 acetylase RimI-like enzyme
MLMPSEQSLQTLNPPSLPTAHPLEIRPLQLRDRAPLHQLLTKDGLFTREEVSVALELVDGALAEPGGEYRALIAERDGRLLGYICYGPTPMTDGTWDLYWVVTHPDARGGGVARALVEGMENEIRGLGARLVRVETSRLDGYGAARAFYQRLDYPLVAELPDFYKPGDNLLMMLKRL